MSRKENNRNTGHVYRQDLNPAYGKEYDRDHNSLWMDEREPEGNRSFADGRRYVSNQGRSHNYDPYPLQQGRDTHGYGSDYRGIRETTAGESARILGNRKETHYGKGPKGWKRSDERIKELVSEALYFNPEVDASQIEVSVQEGVVTLTGQVPNRWMKKEAFYCVDQIEGVRDIHNELRLSDSGSLS